LDVDVDDDDDDDGDGDVDEHQQNCFLHVPVHTRYYWLGLDMQPKRLAVAC
jgi:hypothetical protein